MIKTYAGLLDIYNSIKKDIPFIPKLALVLGSGLSSYEENIEVVKIIDYRDIKDFPISTVKGHKGRFLFGYVGDVPIVAMQGRIHYYEGYKMDDVVLPIRLMKLIGSKFLFLTNAAGSVNITYKAGDFMLISDQISSFVPSPLIGPNICELGERFSDMGDIYKGDLRDTIKNTAKQLDIDLKEGTYIQMTGPNFETKSEISMCRILGADAVGMSTACEAIVGNHMGMKICGISLISNLGCGINNNPLTAEEVEETALRVSPIFKRLVTSSIIDIVENN